MHNHAVRRARHSIMSPARAPQSGDTSGMDVIDLFVGLGGFSAGALAAGATVVMGVDCDSVPLRHWSGNAPSGLSLIHI